MKLLLYSLFFLAAAVGAKAQDFVYTPVNPAFGGNSYNYSWLLSSAEAQKSQAATTADDLDDSSQSELDQFTENLNNQILNQLTNQILESQFGDDFSLENGQYNAGIYQINIAEGASGIEIRIRDSSTGAESNITVPYYQ